MNVDIIDRLIDQDPTLESSRSALEAMKEGACCIHRSWGLGRISGYETDRGMILIDFEEDDKKCHAMDPIFCLGKLEVLEEDHILSRHRANPEEIEKMRVAGRLAAGLLACSGVAEAIAVSVSVPGGGICGVEEAVACLTIIGK